MKIPNRQIGKHQNEHYSLLPCLFDINIIILPSSADLGFMKSNTCMRN